MTERVTRKKPPASSRGKNQGKATTKAPSAKGQPTNARQPRRPHNAREAEPFESLPELVERIGNETLTVVRGSGTVRMSRKERSLRLDVEAALKGNVPALKHLLKLMARHPELIAPREMRSIFINGPLARV
jgi:hypothetical protein